jgi:hypothetical protein
MSVVGADGIPLFELYFGQEQNIDYTTISHPFR